MKLLWLDLETTGLEPMLDSILEVAAGLADFARPFHCPCLIARTLHFDAQGVVVDPRVAQMHFRSGLWDACLESKLRLPQVEYDLLQLAGDNDAIVLAGSSVHFDHGFLNVYMPRLASLLSHRHYDVSAVKLFCQSLGMKPLPKGEAHRAMADVEESVAHARACAEWLGLRC